MILKVIFLHQTVFHLQFKLSDIHLKLYLIFLQMFASLAANKQIQALYIYSYTVLFSNKKPANSFAGLYSNPKNAFIKIALIC